MIQSISARRSQIAAIALLCVLPLGLDVGVAKQSRPGATVCGLETTERIVAVGDVHGAYDRFVAILQEAGLIDQKERWVGGRTVFVQTGDVLDRGADSRKALDLLRRLEKDAPRAGGRVIPLLGNHEVMRILGDMRYVSDGEYVAFRAPDAPDMRERYYQAVLASETTRARAANQKIDEPAFRKNFLEKTPLGFVEMHLAFAADGDYGKWLRSHDTIAVVNHVAFMHGGLTPAVAERGCGSIDTTVRKELQTRQPGDAALEQSLMAGAKGPLWYRGLVDDPPEVNAESLDAILKSVGATTIVVGHTVAPGGRIRATFGGRVIQIDTGMLGPPFFTDGAPSALEIKNGTFTAISIGKREAIARVAAPASSTRR